MAGTGFLRTVNFGGFDKKDVLSYVDELNSKIYNLENELNEKSTLLKGMGENTQTIDGAEKYEEIIAESKAKIGELMGNCDTLKLEVSNLENELSEKDNEISRLKEERVMLEEKLESAKSETGSITEASFDIGSVFIEAKHSADRIITEAKNAAKKIEDDSRVLSQQIIDEANTRGEEIINNAQDNYNKTLADANSQATVILDGTNRTKQSIVASYELVASDIEKLANCLNDIVSNGVLKLTDAKQLIEDRKNAVNSLASMGDIEAEKKNNPISVAEVKIAEPVAEAQVAELSVENTEVADENAEHADDKKLNIDLDLLAGLTAEIESNYSNNDDTYNPEEDTFVSLTEIDENKKISLLEDM